MQPPLPISLLIAHADVDFVFGEHAAFTLSDAATLHVMAMGPAMAELAAQARA